MILKRNSKLVRWAYWIDRKAGEAIPQRTNLCGFFWRAFFVTPIIATVVGGVLIVFSPIWVPIWAIDKLVRKYHPFRWVGNAVDNIADTYGDSLVSARLTAWHDKVCPIIKLED